MLAHPSRRAIRTTNNIIYTITNYLIRVVGRVHEYIYQLLLNDIILLYWTCIDTNTSASTTNV